MERTAYRYGNARRTSRTSGVSRRGVKETPSFKETVLAQCLITGIVLLALMLVCMVKTDLTASLRYQLRQGLSKQMTLDETFALFNDLQNSVKTIFGNANGVAEETGYSNEPVPPIVESPVPAIEEQVKAADDFRIDEDILEMLAEMEGGAEKKPLVPETNQ